MTSVVYSRKSSCVSACDLFSVCDNKLASIDSKRDACTIANDQAPVAYHDRPDFTPGDRLEISSVYVMYWRFKDSYRTRNGLVTFTSMFECLSVLTMFSEFKQRSN